LLQLFIGSFEYMNYKVAITYNAFIAFGTDAGFAKAFESRPATDSY
jgi:hypothetical protein